MSVAIKNNKIGPSVNLYLNESYSSELSSDEDNFNVPEEADTQYTKHSLQTDCIAVRDTTRSKLKTLSKNIAPTRKRPRVLSSDEESNSEPPSRSVSPEIPYGGTPVAYKLQQLKGEFLIIKVPMNKSQTRSKKCSDRDITKILDSESDEELIFSTRKENRCDVVGSLSGKWNNEESPGAFKDKVPKRATRSCRSRSKDTILEQAPRSCEYSEEDEEEEEPVSLRIKLRRSTEQSNYKVQTIFDSDERTRKSSKRSNVVTPKRSSIGNCEEDDSARKRTRATPKIPTSSMASRSNPTRRMSTTVKENKGTIEQSRPMRVVVYGPSDYERDRRRLEESLLTRRCDGASKSPGRDVKTPERSRNKLDEAMTPSRSLRPRRNSRVVNRVESDSDQSENILDKENKSENDLEDDSDSVSWRSRTRQKLARSVVRTPRKEMKILEEPSMPKSHNDGVDNILDKENKSENDLEDDSDSVSWRGRTRQKLSGSVVRTPRKEIKILEEPTMSKRTPGKSVLPDLQQETPKGKTPRRSEMKRIREEPGTPTTPRRTPSDGRISRLVDTPSMRKGNLTPSMSRRTANIGKPVTILEEARAKLHVSAIPKSLPCREEQFNGIYQFLERKLLDNNSGCIYISGVPGTGKTATVNEVIRCLKKLVVKGDLENFDYVEINGMKLSEPRQAYVQILKQINGQTATWEQAYEILDTRFTKSSNKRPMTLLLVDELDLLCNKRQDVVYNLLDWPAKGNARLVVITIANTMDLPERVLMGRVTSRLGLTRLTFQPYNHKQLQEIVMARLKDSDAFKNEAVQLVARKVAAVSGDARRALDICRRATEIAELNDGKIVTMKDVNQALSEMIASAKVRAIKHCSELEKMFLQAVCTEVARTGVEETNFYNVYRQLESLCSLEGLTIPNVTQALGICGRLGANRLLLCEHSRTDTQQRILLNVCSDDIHFAMQKINIE